LTPPPPVAAGSSSTPATGTASPLAAVTYNILLPASLEKKENAVFEFKLIANSKMQIAGCVENATSLIDCLKNELNEKFMCELGDFSLSDCEYDPEFDTEYAAGSGSGPGPYDELRLVFVGGSHASRLAQAAQDLGIDTVNLSVPGFRVTGQSVNSVFPKLEEALNVGDKRCVVIYHLYDNNVFFLSQDDGSRSLAVKGSDNIYHIPGKLLYADCHVVKNLVNTTVPLLRAAGEKEMVVLSPLPRYLKRCCSNEEHLTNRREKRKFCIKMGEAMSEIKDTIRDVIFGKKIRSFKVLSSLLLLADADDPDQYENFKHLQEDPVHQTKDGASPRCFSPSFSQWRRAHSQELIKAVPQRCLSAAAGAQRR
jgi:hypothetical protein